MENALVFRKKGHFHQSTSLKKENTKYFLLFISERRHAMKIVASKQELMKSLGIVLRAVPSRTTMSILYCILIDATVDTIKFTSNDMELGIETTVNGSIEERGLICLDAKMFSDIIRKMPENDITIEVGKDYQTTISCEQSVFRIVGKDTTEFSPLPSIDRKDPVTLTQLI